MMTLIVCYVPTNSVNRHDVLILGGDMNARVRDDDSRRERCMGKFGLGVMNENGRLFADFCQEN